MVKAEQRLTDRERHANRPLNDRIFVNATFAILVEETICSDPHRHCAYQGAPQKLSPTSGEFTKDIKRYPSHAFTLKAS